MPSVSWPAAAIVNTITDFEQSVVAAEGALAVRDWSTVDALLSDQRRLTHALLNALDESPDERPAAFTAEVERRLAAVSGQCAGQLRRLIAFNHAVGLRLTVVSRSREMRRGCVNETPSPQVLDSQR